ncbi:Uncharacterised protein [Neisseria meningitidis]|nr:Uncharacterised protein [Neisseria meningitidis]CWO82176.1 Uncharacterised protein [Neisseria meningitidis]
MTLRRIIIVLLCMGLPKGKTVAISSCRVGFFQILPCSWCRASRLPSFSSDKTSSHAPIAMMLRSFSISPTIFSIQSGAAISSASVRAIYSPIPDFANSSSPMFKEGIRPELRGCARMRMRPSCSWKRWAMASVPSVEPSSTIKISKLRQV